MRVELLPTVLYSLLYADTRASTLPTRHIQAVSCIVSSPRIDRSDRTHRNHGPILKLHLRASISATVQNYVSVLNESEESQCTMMRQWTCDAILQGTHCTIGRSRSMIWKQRFIRY